MGRPVVCVGLALSAAPQYTLTQLTRDPGITYQPVISPNGELVAYASDRAGDDNLDIYVQQIGGGGVIRLTDHSAHDREPSSHPMEKQSPLLLIVMAGVSISHRRWAEMQGSSSAAP